MPKMVHFGEFLEIWSLRSNSVTRRVTFNRTKNRGKCQNSKIQMRHFEWFSNNVVFGRHECDDSRLKLIITINQWKMMMMVGTKNPMSANSALFWFLRYWYHIRLLFEFDFHHQTTDLANLLLNGKMKQ